MEITGTNQLKGIGQKIRIRDGNRTIAQQEESPCKVLATVVLPAYNEVLAMPAVLDDLICTLDGDYEILVVDDGSSDGTSEVASRYPCRVIRHAKNQGKGAAVRTGILHARGDFIIVMDADASYPAAPIPQMMEMLCKSSDVIRCIRRQNKENMPLVNRVGNFLFDLLLTKFGGLDGVDHLSGLYGLRKDILCNMKLESDGFDLEAEISMKARTFGLKTGFLPIDYLPRLGEKKLNAWRDGWHILTRIILLALVFNPVFTFILPGLAIILIGITSGAILSTNSIVTPYFGLDIHSFILAVLATLTGFQLAIFGIAATLYGVEAGYKTGRWVKTVISTPVRLGAGAVGLVSFFYSTVAVITMIARWLMSGAGPFTDTHSFILAITAQIGGMQLLSDALFISIFAGSAKKKMNPSNALLEQSS